MAFGSYNNSLMKSLAKPSRASKVPGGYGNVPGMGKQSNPKPMGSGFGGGLTNSLGTGAANVIPTFTPQVPGGPNFQAAQGGQQAQLGAGGGSGGTASHTDPRDPTYWTDTIKIKNTFDANDTSYNQQQTAGQTALDKAIASYDKQEPIDTSNARGQFNNAGLFYSSKLTGAEGDIASTYSTRRTDARAGFAGLVNSLNTLRGQNQQTYGRGPNGELTGTAYLDALNNATGRQEDRDSAAATANILAGLNPDGSPKEQAAAPGPQPGQLVNGQFVSGGITSPATAALINQWIQQNNQKPPVVTGSYPQKKRR
jgi:hypothetical protein